MQAWPKISHWLSGTKASGNTFSERLVSLRLVTLVSGLLSALVMLIQVVLVFHGLLNLEPHLFK